EPKRQLLLDRPIEQAAPGAGPVEELRRVRGVDGLFAQRRQRRQLGPLLRRQPPGSSLLHRPSFHVRSPFWRWSLREARSATKQSPSQAQVAEIASRSLPLGSPKARPEGSQ